MKEYGRTLVDLIADVEEAIEREELLRRMCEYVLVIGEQNELSDKKLIFL